MPVPGDPNWVATLPSLATQVDRKPARGWLRAGVSSGIDDIQSLLGSAVQGGGKLFGLPSIEAAGRDIAARNQLESQQNGRPDLELAPWKDGGAPILPWLGYQAAKQAPLIATYLLGAKAYNKFGGAVPGIAEDIGTMMPRALGGGGVMPGSSFSVRRAALVGGAREAGQDFGRQLTGGAVAGLPIAFGSMVQEADQKPGGITSSDVKKAALLSPVYSALDAIEPAGLAGLFKRGQAGNIIRRIATASFTGAAAEVPQEGLQTALEQSFRPDLSFKDKMMNIVDAAATGGAVGGVFGGFGGIRAMKRIDPTMLDAQDLDSIVGEVLGLPPPESFRGSAPAPGQVVGVGGDGSASVGPSAIDFASSEFDRPKAAPRPYESTPTEELQQGIGAAAKRIKDGTATDTIRKFVEEAHGELQIRNASATSPAVANEPVGAVQPELDQRRGTAEQISEAPAPASDWATQQKTLLKGISTRKWYQQAQSLDELDTILRARLEDGSTAKSDMELAKRRGIDVNAPAAPVAAKIEGVQEQASQQAPVAEAPSADFKAQWKADVQTMGQKDKGARSIKPANVDDARVQIYRALGRKGEIGDGLEALAQKYGVLDENKQLTPLAIEIAKKDPIPTEVAVKAAIAQGYKGKAASMFDRGVQAALGNEQVVKFKGTEEFAAYMAGSKWAEEHNSVPKVASNYWTAGVMRSQKGGTITGTEASPVPPLQLQQQSANQAIDATRAGFGTSLDDIAELKRMVRNGNTEAAMEGLVRVQRGEPLIQRRDEARYYRTGHGALANAAPIVSPRGETVLPGAPRSRESQVNLVPTKAASRVAAEKAIRKYEVSRAIDAAFRDGRIDGRTRIKMVGKLRQGKIAEILKTVPVEFTPAAQRGASMTEQHRSANEQLVADLQDALIEAQIEDEVQELTVDERGVLQSPQVKATRRQFLTGVAAVAASTIVPSPVTAATSFDTKASEALRTIIENGGQNSIKAEGALKWIAANSKDSGYRLIATKLLRGESLAGKVDLALRADSDEVRGLSTVRDDGTVIVELFGSDGVNEQTILHELIHAYIQLRWSGLSTYIDSNRKLLGDTKDRGDTDIIVFQSVWSRIRSVLKLTNPGLVDEEVWANQVYQDPDEMMAWVLTNPDAQAYFKSVTPEGDKIAQPKPEGQKTLWDKIVDFFSRLFGGGSQVKTALDDILGAGYAVLDAGVSVSTDDFTPKFAAALAKQRNSMPMLKTAGQWNDRAQGLVGALTSKVPIESASSSTRRMVFGWNTIGHLVAHYVKQFPNLSLYAKAHLERRATQARWAQLFEAPYQAYETMDRTNKKAAEDIRYLMSLTQFEIDPTKTWAQHEHLHGAANAARLQELVDGANRKYNALRGKGIARVYDDFRAINEATHLSMMAVSLHNLVASDPVLKQGMTGFEQDPTDAFRERPALHESPQNAKSYWTDVVNAQVARATEYIQQLRGTPTGTASEQRLQSMRLEPIEMRIRSIRESLNAMNNSPYFHLGRHGNHFVSFTLRVGADKKVDPAAIDHAGKMIQQAGIPGVEVEISRDSLKPNVYIRTETIEARAALEKVVQKLKTDGWLKPESEIKAAPRTDASDVGTADSSPAWLERYIELLQASPMFEPTSNMTDDEKGVMAARKAQMVSHARELWLDMLPDTALSKVMVHRNSVPGFDKDMIRNFAFRFQVGTNALANLSASSKLNDAFTKMRADVFDAQKVGSPQHANVDLMQSLLSEVLVREAQRPLSQGKSWIDTFRALNHFYFLGMSPSYVAINTTQLGVLLWPELAKKHGYAKSAKAIASVTKQAFDIMSETFKAGAKVGPRRALDAVITEDVLIKAGLSEGTANFMMKLIADGIIDIGGASREMGRVAEGKVNENLDTFLRWGSAFGLYSETFTRLVAALSARKLAGDDYDYAHKVIDQSMLNYSDWNTARQMGKMGFAGPMTKVMTAFMQYNAQVLEKLYREFHTLLLNKAATVGDKAEAKRFIFAHLTAVTALAGTLGLPFASVAALAIEKLVDLLDDDDEPFDATAWWRNFMAGVLGPELGDMVSRGVPRAGMAGFDLSQRAGEQNLLPFSQFLTDKRKWHEASAEASLRSAGAPVSMLLNIMEGGEKIGNGDIMGGLIAAAPTAVRGPAKAYQMTDEGYVDTLGNKLPMTPGSTAILSQLLGFTPAERAEYSEERGDQAARKGVLFNRAKVIRNDVLNALADGDDEVLDAALDRAKSFDMANPAYATLPDIMSSLKRRAKMQVTSEVTRTPIGTSPKDRGARDLTRYSPLEYEAQR